MLEMIAAVGRNLVIGVDGDLPWHLPEDLAYFKQITMGRAMIMGRKSFEAIGRPLPGRRTIVVTRSPDWCAEGVEVASSLDKALVMGRDDRPIITGGGEIYRLALPRASHLLLTEVDLEPDGDAFFPTIDPTEWAETSRVHNPSKNGRPAFDFVVYARVDTQAGS